MQKVTVKQLQQIAPNLGHQAAASKNYQVMPMFLPTDISAKKDTGVIKVVTRQAFMNEKITHWVLYNATRGGTIAMAGGALLLLPVNPILAAVAGLAAGYFYGKHKYYTFLAINQPRHRWLLEGT